MHSKMSVFFDGGGDSGDRSRRSLCFPVNSGISGHANFLQAYILLSGQKAAFSYGPDPPKTFPVAL